MATPQIPAGYKLVPDEQEQNMAPQARGKAAALSAYLARKGSPKGNKLDRLVQKFETMWAKAPVSVKEKYAGRVQTDLAPSERPDITPIQRPTNASLNAARPGETPAQMYARQRQSRMGTPPPVAAPTATPGVTPIPIQPIGESNPDGTRDTSKYPDGQAPSFEDLTPAKGTREKIAEQGAVLMDEARASMSPATPPPVAGPTAEATVPPYTPPASLQSVAGSGQSISAGEIAAAKARPPQTSRPAPTQTIPASPSIQPPIANRVPDGQQVIPRPADVNGRRMDPAIAGDASGTKVRINSLTGLPFGFNPGDALPASADPAMQGRAAASQNRMQANQANAPARVAPPVAPPSMPRGPASQAAPTGSALDDPNNAFSSESYARTAAAKAKGEAREKRIAGAKNEDDPKKFFTGRTLPLDQLVKNQRVSGSPPPVRRPVAMR